MYHEHRSWGLFLFRIFEIVVTVNIVLLDFFVFHNLVSPSSSTPAATIALPTTTPTPSLNALITQTPPATAATTIINQTTGAKEIFIPIGQGQTAAIDWTSIPGAQVSVDSTKYTSIKQIVFEATLENPNNQIAWVRLYNQTDGHPVWYSEMNMSSTNQFLTSQAIQLDYGAKLYQVQMKTQLGYNALLDQSRIHIILQ